MALDIVAQDLIIDETTGLQDDDVSVTNTTVNYLLGLDSAGGLTSPEVAFQSNFVVASASAGETINSVILAQDASGTPFSTTVGVNSGIQTVDGDYVWLFKDPTHANVVIGVIGTSDPAAEPLETGPLAFSFALINTSNTNADLYTVQYVPLLHNSPGDGTLNTYDERIDLANKVFASVTATTVLNFSQLGDAPPGHNNWYILDADVASTQKILVTAHDTGVQSEVNVSTQGLGVASQDVRFGRELQIDLINGGTQSAGKNFTDAPIAPNYDSHVENVSNAGFSISQSTPTNTKADIEVHAYNNDDNAEGAALPGDDNDTEINITAVTFKLNGVTTTAAALGITVDLSGTGMILRNVGEGVTVDFTTAGGVGGTFDRFTIKNIDADKDYFDVKEVHYGSDVASAYQEEVGSFINFDDDGPTIDPSAAVVPTLTTDDTAIPDSDGPTSFADLFTSAFGADGFKDADDNNVEDADAISYALSVSSAGVDSGLVDTISGDKIYLFLQGGVVNGRVGLDNDAGSNAAGAVAFSISVNADTGAVTLTQNNSVVHNDPNDPVETGLSAAGMSAVLVKLTATITDGDGDTDTATRNIGDAFKFEDDGPSAPIVTVSTAVIEDETSGVNATPDPHDADDTGDAAVVALFSVLPAGTTLSFAKSSAPLVTLSGGGFGNDGPAAVDDVTYALSVVDGTASSLSTTEGTQIFLYNGTGVLEGLILGRVGNELPGGDTANASGAIAFALAVDDDGFGYIAHRMAINSGPGGSLPADFDNVVAIAVGAVQIAVTYTDGDGDHATTAPTNIGTLFTFQDDGPVITEPSSAGTPATAAHLGNEAGQSAIGDFEYDIGSDNHSAAFYTAGGSDFVDANGGVAGVQLSLSGTVSGPPSSAITNTNVTLFSEDADSAVFDFSFDYDKDPINAGVQTGTATGTLTFDKDAGTFTLEMGTPVEGFSFNILHTSDLLAKQPVGNTGHPQIVVERLAVDDPNTTIDEDFYVQFTANTKTGGKHPIGFGFNSTGEGATVGDNVFNNDGATHDLITNLHEDWVSATQTTNGVAGDTIQQGEALALRFFGSDVLGDVASGTEQTNPTTTAQGVTIEFDNIGNSEDLMVVLDLIDKDGADNILGGAGAADDNTEITRAVYIQNSDIYKNTPGGIPSPYTGEFDIDNNDGLVIIESNDYNAANEDYEIQGVQIMQSGNGLTGQAIDLNKAIGDSGFSSTTSLVVWDGSDQDVIKIVDIGFIQSGSGTQEANLDFSYQIADGDLDVTGVQHIFANISNQWIV